MATALKLKSDIKKLKAAINSKATPKSFLPKLKNQLERAEGELKSLKEAPKGGKPKKSTSAGTEKTLTALQKLVNKKKYSVYKGRGVDLKKDAGEGALATGRRVSKGLKSNQWGEKSSNKGNVYYEYRPNRLDVKQPKKKQTYPKLEDGGILSKEDFLKKSIVYDNGGKSLDRYTVFTPDGSVYAMSETAQGFNQYVGESDEISKGSHLGKRLKSVPKEIEWAVIGRMEFADGGYMAKGGIIGNYELTPYVKGIGDLYNPKYQAKEYFEGTKDDAIKKANSMLSAEIGMVQVYIVNPKATNILKRTKKIATVVYKDGGMMAKGGEIRYKLKGSNFGQQVENGQKFKALISKVHANQTGENKYPENLIKEIAYTGKIVKSDGSNYLKDYSYKGTLTKFEFLDDKDFIEALKYVDRPAIRKFEEGGYMASGGEVKAKYKVGDMVYSYQNKDYPAPISYTTEISYPNEKVKYKLKLKDGYSNWINEDSLSESKMASGGELHRSEEKYAEGGTIYSEDKLKEIIDEEILTPLYNVINGFDMLSNYLRKTNRQVHLTKTLSLLNYLQILEASEKIEEYTSKK